MYTELRPPPQLAGIVECLWRHELSEPGSDTTGMVLPDGRMDVIWIEGGEALVAGPQTRAVPRPLEPPFTAIGMRLLPGAGPALLGLAAHELVDTHVPLAQLDTAPAAALRSRLDAAEDAGAALRALAAGLDGEPDPLVRAAAELLDGPGATVDGVARSVALSERQLQRRFRDHVGYGPKTLQRVLRFQRLLGTGGEGLARAALESGYADQAHLTREVRRLAGITPVRLRQLFGPRP
jgi:AraC-like DNA-binding protein